LPETRRANSNHITDGTAKINSALSEHISVSMAPNGIAVSVADGKVTLAGTFSSGNLRDKAEKIAQGIAGVREIDNRIISVPSRGSGF
jgi:osmotically-inducible protein OsmY